MRNPLAALRERFARAPRVAQSSSSLSLSSLPTWKLNKPLPPVDDFRTLLEIGYRRETIIFACVREIAQSVAEPALRLSTGEGDQRKDIPKHPVLDILEKPNPRQNGFEFLELLLTHIELVGNGYIHKLRNVAGVPVGLELLRPDRVKPIPGAKNTLQGYVHTIEGTSVGDTLPPEDVIHIRLPDPCGDYFGLPPVSVAAAIADLDVNAIDFLRGFFLNDGTPAGLLTLSTPTDAAERERIKDRWREERRGLKGWHSLAVLDSDVKYQQIGADPGKMRLDGVLDSTEARLCMVWGVPPIIIGTRLGLEHGTYSNYEQAAQSFWRETLKPVFKRISLKLTTDLAHDFDEQLDLWFDTSTVEILQDSRDAKRSSAQQAWTTNAITLAEYRTAIGFVARPEDQDVYYSDVNAPAPSPFGAPADPNADPTAPPSKRKPPVADDPSPTDGQYLEAVLETTAAPLGLVEQLRDPLFRTLHTIADQATPAVQRVFLEAVARAINKTTLRKVQAALAAKDLEKALAAIPWESEAVKLLEARLPPQLQQIAVQAANASAPAAGLDLNFAADAPAAVHFAATRSAQLVREVTDETKRALRKTIGLAIQEGRPPLEAAKQIRSMVGLTMRQALAVEAVRAREGDAAAEKARERAMKRRALTIARTETIHAANSGQQEMWVEGEHAGLFDRATAKRVWIVTPDDSLCPYCTTLDGMTVELDQQFDPGTIERADGSLVTLNPVLVPPLHPNCRCAIGLEIQPG